jgi:hypothetical protein
MTQIDKNTPTLSVCIPTWDQNGLGSNFLNDALKSLTIQTYKNFQVVISDHSISDDIENVVKNYKDVLNIKYIRNENNRGNGPYNTNFAIDNSDGEIVKILFHDDFLNDDKSLEIIINEFTNPEVIWLVTGSNHTDADKTKYWNEMIPYWSMDLFNGINTISSPSVMSFRKNTNIRFDDTLVMMMDIDMYYNLYLNYGLPKIIPNILVTNRVHKDALSWQFDWKTKDEKIYLRKKYNL